MTGIFVIARHEAISLFCLPALNNRDRHAALAMTGIFVIASLRSNLAFLFATPAQPRSPRFARDDKKMRACEAISPESCHCEARSNLAFLFGLPEQPRSPRSARDDKNSVIASLRSNLSFVRCEASLSLRACEAISLLTVCPHWTTEFATYLCLAKAPLGGASYFVIASLRSNLSFLFGLPEQPRSPRSARDDKNFACDDRTQERLPRCARNDKKTSQ